MRNYLLAFGTFMLSIVNILAQDTFSIVAVDTVTGEVGSAGASCIGGVIIISDPHPGKGAIHTQAWWKSTNQNNASNRMNLGDTPQEIINWLIANDSQNAPELRQYGIVDFDSLGSPRTAAYTGSLTDDYKNHILGTYYTIQGNILLGQFILDSMEARFLNEPGSLGYKLMAALQGANVPGADSRCLAEGVSSLSTFVRVVRPCDTLGTYYMDLQVSQTPDSIEPIDSLQVLFDNFIHDPAPTCSFTYTDSLLTVNFTSATTNTTSIWWDYGDGGGSSNQNPLHIYSTSGTYKACLTATDGCISVTHCETFTLTVPAGVDQYSNSEKLHIYPNPGSGVFTIESDEPMKNASLTVLNGEGREVIRLSDLNGKRVQLDLTRLPKGIYIVRVSTKKNILESTLVFE